MHLLGASCDQLVHRLLAPLAPPGLGLGVRWEETSLGGRDGCRLSARLLALLPLLLFSSSSSPLPSL